MTEQPILHLTPFSAHITISQGAKGSLVMTHKGLVKEGELTRLELDGGLLKLQQLRQLFDQMDDVVATLNTRLAGDAAQVLSHVSTYFEDLHDVAIRRNFKGSLCMEHFYIAECSFSTLEDRVKWLREATAQNLTPLELLIAIIQSDHEATKRTQNSRISASGKATMQGVAGILIEWKRGHGNLLLGNETNRQRCLNEARPLLNYTRSLRRDLAPNPLGELSPLNARLAQLSLSVEHIYIVDNAFLVPTRRDQWLSEASSEHLSTPDFYKMIELDNAETNAASTQEVSSSGKTVMQVVACLLLSWRYKNAKRFLGSDEERSRCMEEIKPLADYMEYLEMELAPGLAGQSSSLPTAAL